MGNKQRKRASMMNLFRMFCFLKSITAEQSNQLTGQQHTRARDDLKSFALGKIKEYLCFLLNEKPYKLLIEQINSRIMNNKLNYRIIFSFSGSIF